MTTSNAPSTLPAIEPYPLPSGGAVPANTVAWPVDPSRTALLVHDMQNHFVRPFAPDADPIAGAVRNIAELLRLCRSAGIPVVYTAQPGGQSPQHRALLTDFWGPGLPDDGDAPAIAAPVAPAESDIVLTKWRYSAFQRTDLLAVLRQHRRDQLLVTGVYAHIGCLATCLEAFMSDVQAFLIADATADFTADDHAWALRYAARRCARVLTAADARAELAPEAGPAAAGLHALRAEIAALLGEDPDAVGVDGNLVDWGLDSIRVMALVEQWRNAGVEVSFAELAERPTVGAWHQLVTRR